MNNNLFLKKARAPRSGFTLSSKKLIYTKLASITQTFNSYNINNSKKKDYLTQPLII